jgi:hypothetical protein
MGHPAALAFVHMGPAPVPHVPKLRPQLHRTRNGCLTCRQRKKKCDETKPRCIACNRNMLRCKWPRAAASASENTAVPASQRTEKTQSKSKQSVDRSSHVSSLCGQDQDVFHDETAVGQNASYRAPRGGDCSFTGTSIHWSKDIGSFLGAERAALLTPSSHVLLEHYLAETGPLLATTPVKINPFVTYIIPLCYSDDLLMHTVLALSGSHLCCKQPGDFDLERATYLHCASVLQSLRIAFQNVRAASTSKVVRLLVILLMLCHFEVGLLSLQKKFGCV